MADLKTSLDIIKNLDLASPGQAKPKTHTTDYVREFHLAFGHPVRIEPQMLSDEEARLRIRLIAEELAEYACALGCYLEVRSFPELYADDIPNNKPHVLVERWKEHAQSTVLAADALTDLDYVVAGANLCHGFPAEVCLNEVHQSNMSKLGADGKPVKREDGKILKGPNYREPDLEPILRVRGMRGE